MISGLCGIILAAGESTRMGRDKALLPIPKQTAAVGALLHPQTLLSSAIRALSEYCDLILVVGGRNFETIAPVVYAEGAFLVRNPEPERGQFSSLQIGLRELLNHGRDNGMVTLVDRLPPQPTTLHQLLTAFANREHDTWAIVPEYEGKHGHPFLIGREMIEAFLQAPAAATAREVEHANQTRLAYIPTDDPLVIANLNTPEDYSSLQSSQ